MLLHCLLQNACHLHELDYWQLRRQSGLFIIQSVPAIPLCFSEKTRVAEAIENIWSMAEVHGDSADHLAALSFNKHMP